MLHSSTFSFTLSCSIVAAALRSLTQINYLEITASLYKWCDIVDECTFPYLRELQCFMPLSSGIIVFLNRHPGLRALTLINDEDWVPEPSTPTLHLPALNSYVGSSIILPFVTTQSPIEHWTIHWDQLDPEHVESVIDALASTKTPISLLCSERFGWDIPLFTAIQQHNLLVKEITMMTITNMTHEIDEDDNFVRVLDFLLINILG